MDLSIVVIFPSKDFKVYIKQGLMMQIKISSFTIAYPMVYHCEDMFNFIYCTKIIVIVQIIDNNVLS